MRAGGGGPVRRRNVNFLRSTLPIWPSESDDIIRRAHVSRSRGQQATASRGHCGLLRSPLRRLRRGWGTKQSISVLEQILGRKGSLHWPSSRQYPCLPRCQRASLFYPNWRGRRKMESAKKQDEMYTRRRALAVATCRGVHVVATCLTAWCAAIYKHKHTLTPTCPR